MWRFRFTFREICFIIIKTTVLLGDFHYDNATRIVKRTSRCKEGL